eukprot:g2237.t1
MMASQSEPLVKLHIDMNMASNGDSMVTYDRKASDTNVYSKNKNASMYAINYRNKESNSCLNVANIGSSINQMRPPGGTFRHRKNKNNCIAYGGRTQAKIRRRSRKNQRPKTATGSYHSPSSFSPYRKCLISRNKLDGSGEIDYTEFIHHFGFKRSRFTKRAFSVMDEDGSGEVDFTEFVLCVWNYCTFNKPALMRFAFELYDEDGSGLIDADELLLMLKELYGKSKYKKNPKAQNVYKKILSQFTNESSGACEITFIDFRNFCIKYPAMLYPAFTVQLNFQNAILGRSYWEAEAKKRRQIEIHVANNTPTSGHDSNDRLGFQNIMQYLNGMNPGNAGESLNDSLLGDKNLTKSTVGEEEQYNKLKISKNGKKLPITTNPSNSKKFIQNKYGNNTSEAWICQTCGRSNNLAKTRCATCKTKKVFSTR